MGPLIFLLSIESINYTEVKGNLGLFADDTREGMAVGNVSDAEVIQSDLSILGVWSESVNMSFNNLKFECVKSRFNEFLKKEYNYMTPDMSEVIEEKESIRDLGVILSSNGEFNDHLAKVITKVKQRMGWIHRSFLTNNIDFRRFMWKTYISGIIDYCSQIWCPTDIVKIFSLEQVLRQYSANTKGLENKNYWERLKLLRLSSLQRRLQRYRIIYIWKIVVGKTHNFGINWKQHPSRGLLIDIKYPKGVSNKVLKIWRQSLEVNGGSLFNAMPYHIRNYKGDTVEGFKMTLDQVLETVPDCPPSLGLYPAPTNCITGFSSNCLIDWSVYLKWTQRDPVVLDSQWSVYPV